MKTDAVFGKVYRWNAWGDDLCMAITDEPRERGPHRAISYVVLRSTSPSEVGRVESKAPAVSFDNVPWELIDGD